MLTNAARIGARVTSVVKKWRRFRVFGKTSQRGMGVSNYYLIQY